VIFDLLLAAALTAFAQLNLRFNIDQSTHYGSGFAAAVATAVATTVLALRRRAPVLTAGVVAAAVAAPELVSRLTITLWGDFVPLLVAAYSVARHAGRRGAAVGAIMIGIALAIVMLRVPVIGTASNFPFTLVPLAGAVIAGRLLGRRQRLHDEASDRARRLETERDESIRTAIADERNRIARELHDIVAHCVSVMVVQAGAAEDLLDRDPDGARPPLRSVQETGRQAVGELQRMLGLLRGEHRDAAQKAQLTPQPGSAELPDLVDHMNEIGLPATLTVIGPAQPLPPGVDLTVYRVVQEALTNTLKHAGAARADVVLTYADDSVSVAIVDTGRGAAATIGTGHGLIGMRERAALYGGRIVAGPGADGGFEVRVDLPIDGVA
jgi:signal transduction histidine kinase